MTWNVKCEKGTKEMLIHCKASLRKLPQLHLKLILTSNLYTQNKFRVNILSSKSLYSILYSVLPPVTKI